MEGGGGGTTTTFLQVFLKNYFGQIVRSSIQGVEEHSESGRTSRSPKGALERLRRRAYEHISHRLGPKIARELVGDPNAAIELEHRKKEHSLLPGWFTSTIAAGKNMANLSSIGIMWITGKCDNLISGDLGH